MLMDVSVVQKVWCATHNAVGWHLGAQKVTLKVTVSVTSCWGCGLCKATRTEKTEIEFVMTAEAETTG